MRLLVYRIGQLGDTLVAVPALHALRAHYPGAHITLLSDRHPGRGLCAAREVLEGSGLIDAFESYAVGSAPATPFRMAGLLLRLRRMRFDLLAYLAPSRRSAVRVRRDLAFFRLAGISRFVGGEGFAPLPAPGGDGRLPSVPGEAEQLLDRLRASGVAVPAQSTACIGIGRIERKSLDTWLADLPTDGGRPWIGIGPGSKMPAKIWPADRYAHVVERLIRRFDVWPVVFGGAEDRLLGDSLLQRWGRGSNAAGALGVRVAAAALQRCHLYLGNDTGTMHLAAAAGTRCVALFSARTHPGLWNPHGAGHAVFRVATDCEGCMLERCTLRGMECLAAIDVKRVESACAHALSTCREMVS